MAVNDPRGDYSRMKVQEKDLAGQKYILSEYFKSKGHDNKFINELLDDYQESGKLYNKAQNAQKALASAQEQYKKQMIVQQQQQQQQQMQEQNKFWNGVYETIEKSKEFQGIKIVEREKGKFFDYLSKPVTKEGYTKSLKERIRKHQETIKSARKASRTPNKAVDIEDLDLSLF